MTMNGEEKIVEEPAASRFRVAESKRGSSVLSLASCVEAALVKSLYRFHVIDA